jgi:hypothetical protein
MSAPKSEFRLALEANIKNVIRVERAHGTVGMSSENLYRVVPPPSSTLKGAPRGTNEVYYYREMFNEVAREVAGRFLLGGAS